MSMTPISIQVDELFEDSLKSFLSAAAVAGGTTISLDNISQFAINKILLIGEIGGEKSEIIKTHASTVPSGSTVTLAAALVFAHPIGTVVYILDYDQVEISWSATEDGSKTVLATQSIQADSQDTLYTDTSKSSGFFFVRYKNSISNTYTDYSDPIPISGYEDNMVGKIIEYALRRNKTGFTQTVTHDFCIDEINACLDEAHGKLKRWATLQEFDYSLGNLVRGSNSVALPSNMYQYSIRSLLDIRIGTGKSLSYLDKKEWVERLQGIANTTIDGAALIGDTDITLTDVSDFEDSGTILIDGMLITYTDRDTATRTLSGIPSAGEGAITSNISDGAEVWQGAEEGYPEVFTIFEGELYFYPLASSQYVGRRIIADYWKEAPTVDSDYDTLSFNRFRMAQYWLTWAIRAQMTGDGARSTDDADYKKYLQTLADAMKNEGYHNQKFPWKPKLNKMQM